MKNEDPKNGISISQLVMLFLGLVISSVTGYMTEQIKGAAHSATNDAQIKSMNDQLQKLNDGISSIQKDIGTDRERYGSLFSALSERVKGIERIVFVKQP